MKKSKYIVEVCRISYSRLVSIEVEAKSREEAESLALDEAGNLLFRESSSEYSVESCTRND